MGFWSHKLILFTICQPTRYANSKDMQQGYAAHLAARNEESVGRRDTPQQETKKAMHDNPAEVQALGDDLL
jgi:hypothetical protein